MNSKRPLPTISSIYDLEPGLYKSRQHEYYIIKLFGDTSLFVGVNNYSRAEQLTVLALVQFLDEELLQ